MIDPEEYKRVRYLLDAALRNHYADLPDMPREYIPGYWLAWPYREVSIELRERKLVSRPIVRRPTEPFEAGTGQVQVVIKGFGDGETVSHPDPHEPFDEHDIARAAAAARKWTDKSAEQQGANTPEAQLAWRIGYEAFSDLEDAGKEEIWVVREKAWAQRDPHVLDNAARELILASRIARPDEWERIETAVWRRDAEAIARKGMEYSIDDWELSKTKEIPFGVKEWRPRDA
jgi:hypothetical protein